MRLFFTFLIIYFISNNCYADVCTAKASTNWCSSSTWDCGRVPNVSDEIVIPQGFTVTVDCNQSGFTGFIKIYGNLVFQNGRGLTAANSATVVIGSSGFLSGGNGGSGLWIGNSGGTAVYVGTNPTSTTGPKICTYTGCVNGVLPITLLSFDGFIRNHKAEISWTVSSEKENKYFILEKSIDGVNFILFKQLNDNSFLDQLYSYTVFDESPYDNITYYRLKQIDANQSFSYSKIISLVNNQNNNLTVSVYPNPNNGTNINLKVNGAYGKDLKISINDLFGNEIYSNNIIVNDLSDIKIVPNQSFKSGMYMISIYLEGAIIKNKLLVE